MTSIRVWLVAIVAASLLLPLFSMAQEEIPQHRAKQIWDAAPEKPRAAPKGQRKVLIWNTPDHLYAKDPHKGYCIPYGTCAIETLGKKTGAFEPVVSGDLAMYLPENIKQFDAIVMNNSGTSGGAAGSTCVLIAGAVISGCTIIRPSRRPPGNH